MPKMSKRRAFRSINADFRAAVAAHARFMTKPMRSSAKAGEDSDAKAAEYARWIVARDSIDLEALAAVSRDAHNAKHQPIEERRGRKKWQSQNADFIDASAPITTRTERAACQFGMRPRFVHFVFAHGETSLIYGDARRPLSRPVPIFTLELPNWAARVDFDDVGEAEPETVPFFSEILKIAA